MENLVRDLIPSESYPSDSTPLSNPFPSSLFPSILFLPTYQQYTGSLCGFHALFNSISYLTSLFSAKNPQKSILSGWKFWKMYHQLLSFLIKNGNLSQKAISTLEDSGPLERYQLQFLLDRYPAVLSLGKKVYWAPVYFGFGQFQMSD